MRKHLAAAALLICTGSTFADTVVLNNGDKLTGTIEEVNPTSVVVTTPYAGKLTVARDAVKNLNSDKPVTIVSPTGKEQMYVSPAAEGTGWRTTPQAVPPPPAPIVPPERATNYLNIGPGWKNQFSFGASTTSGNDQTTLFTTNLTLHYTMKPDEVTIKFDGAYGKSNGRQTEGLASQDAIWTHDWNEKVYGFWDDDVRYDAIKGISFQGSTAIGLGYWLANTPKFKVDVRGGPGITYLKTFDGNESTNASIEAGLRIAYAFDDRTTLAHEDKYTQAVSDFDIWRIHSETALLYKLSIERGLGLKLAFDDDYENQPSAGRKNNDTRLTLSLTLDF